MSRDIGADLPDDLFDALSRGETDPSAGRAIVLVSVDPSGWPHPALLSFREVTAIDRRTLRLVTYSDSSTTGNLRERGKVTLVFVDERMVYYIKGEAQEVAGARKHEPSFATVDVTIQQVLEDYVGADEAGTRITSGIVFQRG